MEIKKFENQKHRDKVLDRIKKLVNHSKGTQYEAEADTAMKMAQSYMRQYGLSMSEVESLEEKEDKEIIKMFVDREARAEKWEGIICLAIEIVCEVRTFIDFYKGKKERMVFVGYKKDVELAKVLHLSLFLSARRQARKNFPHCRPSRKSYLLGFSTRLRERAYEEKQKDFSENKSYAVIVVSKVQEISSWLDENEDLRKRKSSNRSIDPAAYLMGQEDAENIDLHNRQKVGTGLSLTYSGGK